MAEKNEIEEEILIYVTLEPNVTPHELENDPKIKIIGIDGENPIIEINGKVFEGTYDFSVGTNLFFEKDLNPPPLDPLYDKKPKEMYKFATKTTKMLKTKRIFLEKIKIEEDEAKHEENMNDSELEDKNLTYAEALHTYLKSDVELSDESSEADSSEEEDEDDDE